MKQKTDICTLCVGMLLRLDEIGACDYCKYAYNQKEWDEMEVKGWQLNDIIIESIKSHLKSQGMTKGDEVSMEWDVTMEFPHNAS